MFLFALSTASACGLLFGLIPALRASHVPLVSAFREALHRLQLPYALGVSSQLTVFLGTPRVAVPPPTGGRGAYRGAGAPLTFPIVRGLVRETFTALLFASKPEYLKWMIRAQRLLPLRI